MMCTGPVGQRKPSTAAPDAPDSPPVNTRISQPAYSSEKSNGVDEDLEGAYNLDNLDPAIASAEAASSLRGLTFSSIINQIWHFCSVDYGPKCTITSQ
jgi:hypothetical protein